MLSLISGKHADILSERGDSRILEKGSQFQIHMEYLTHHAEQSHRQQRMAAHIKETSIHTDRIDVQQCRPYSREHFFNNILWLLWKFTAARPCAIRRCQYFPVQLPIWRARH